MIVGSGMLAQAFHEYYTNNNILIFASGVSHSLEKDKYAFQREEDLVKETISENPHKLFVYFSTCSMYDPIAKDTLYVQHKLSIENLISIKSNNYIILRVSQIFGRSKSPTLLNFLFEKIEQEKKFDLWKNSNRNIISLNDVVNISKKLIEEGHTNQIFHISNKMYIDVLTLVQLIENVLSKEANYTLLDKGEKYQTIPHKIESICAELNITFNKDYYLKNLLTYAQTH